MQSARLQPIVRLHAPRVRSQISKIYMEPGFTESLAPIPGAVEALQEMLADGELQCN